MRCLIRRIVRRFQSGDVHQDSEVQTDALTLGRATGQQVFLPDPHVSLEHAVIKPLSPGKYTLQSRSGSQLSVNRRIQQLAVIQPGDEIRLGRSQLHVIEPPTGYDLALVIEPPVTEGHAHRENVSALSLREAGLRIRPWAWLLLLLVLAGGLLLPLWRGLAEMHRAPAPVAAGGTEAVRLLNAAPGAPSWTQSLLPGPGSWIPGPLSMPHRFLGKDCARCHQAAFSRVSNAACLACHVNLPGHADTHPALAMHQLQQARCTACHQEHLGNAALVSRTDRLCTACHADPHADMPGSELPPVRDFARAHPEFRVAVLELTPQWQFTTRLVSLDQPGLTRSSGLKYPHDVHLKPGGVKRSDGTLEVLSCGSCHIPDAGKNGFLAQSFQQQCQRCHELTFEPTDPTATLPHGNVAAAWNFLQGYYARVALTGGYAGKGGIPLVAAYRRPAQVLTSEQRKAALDWASRKAAAVAQEVFDYRLCVTCHEVRHDASQSIPWQIAPLRQQLRWFPEALFSHAAHQTLHCESCHAARTSKHNSEILMPRIAVCRDCHGGAVATARVPSTCITCHGFHQAHEHGMDGRLLPLQFGEQSLGAPPP